MADFATRHTLSYLPPAAARLGAALARPRTIAVLCIVALAGLGWASLGLLAGRAAEGGTFAELIAGLCRPSGGPRDVWTLALVLPMWGAMVLAMMLPSAGPMILTYAEIADTAAEKRETVVSPLVLAGGYAAVWLGFAFAVALLQVALTGVALIGLDMSPASRWLPGALFLSAGLYQFSALKRACLALCQKPFPYLFANWTTKSSGVFRLGLRQGLHCLGCCWAMMLLMFAFGVMNILWMAALGMVMTAEKLSTTHVFSRVLGSVLIATGAVFLASAIAAMG